MMDNSVEVGSDPHDDVTVKYRWVVVPRMMDNSVEVDSCPQDDG